MSPALADRFFTTSVTWEAQMLCKTGNWITNENLLYSTGNSAWGTVVGRKSKREMIYGYTGIFLVAQMVKNMPEMRETWVQSLGHEDPLENGMATHSNILAMNRVA